MEMIYMKKTGFTLIELIIVIAIIGVLAAILVPAMLGYVRKARRAVDVNTAKELYYNMVDIVGTDEKARDSFYRHGSSYRVPFHAHDEVTGEDYDICWTLKIDGCKQTKNPKAWAFVPIDGGTHDDIAYAANIRYQFSTSSRYVHLPMKLNGKLPDGSYVNRWFVGFRKNDEEQIEIWAVDAREGTQWSGVPICRVYPSPSSLYR